MRTLYIDCGMGAAGDMLTAALLELLPNKDAFLHRMNHLGIPGVVVSAEKRVKCGIAGTHFSVKVHDVEEDDHLHDHTHDHHHDHHHHHHHGSMDQIRSIVNGMPIPTMVKLDIMAVYSEIAEAESHAHGVPVDQIHFHEVGSMDAVADITAVCLLMHELDVDRIIASPVHVGSGTVRCAHGVLPVPAPATAYILKNVPVYGGKIQSELCTPTGAALLKHFVEEYGDMPGMKVSKIGYGMGKKDFERANCVRVMLGESADTKDAILELNCNIDDMTGEAMGFALEQLMEHGALDAFTIPIGMKKSRPGFMLTVLCKEANKEEMVRLIFQHTTTLGIREKRCERYVLERRIDTVDTPYGKIRRKVSTGYGVQRVKLEHDDLARIAKEQNLSLSVVLEKVNKK
jgi:uncharacterized protein (TIGR00299 family) protein